MLYLFTRLHGVVGSGSATLINEMIHLVIPDNHAYEPNGTYSDGNEHRTRHDCTGQIGFVDEFA